MPVSVYLFSLFNSNLVVSCLYTLLSSPAAVFMTTESRRGRSVGPRCPGLHLGILRSVLQHYYRIRMRHCRHRVLIYTFAIRKETRRSILGSDGMMSNWKTPVSPFTHVNNRSISWAPVGPIRWRSTSKLGGWTALCNTSIRWWSTDN